jgi:heme exporter protein B
VLTTAAAVLAKDLRIELRSKVAVAQLLPFTIVTVVLFAFALDPNASLRGATPGLFWVAVLLVLLLGVQRSYALETADGALDAVRMNGLEPAGVFLGKTCALALQLVAVEAVMAAAMLVLYDPTKRGAVLDPAGQLVAATPFHASFSGVVLFVTTMVAASIGLAATGTLFGALTAGSRLRDTLLPLLVFPVVAPVLIFATRATEATLGIDKATPSDGWPAVVRLTVFTAVSVATGLLAFGPLSEEA